MRCSRASAHSTVLAVALAGLLTARAAHTSPLCSDPSLATPAADGKVPLAEAKRLYSEGRSWQNNGNCERAADAFLRSRAVCRSRHNTVNAAVCLSQLGRFDEAIELYEELDAVFRDELSEHNRAAIGPALERLRGKVGRIAVSSNVEGVLVIDGRERGRLPLAEPLWMLRGERRLRVIKDGYATAERTVNVTAKELTRVDVRLEALAASGQLRVESRDGDATRLFVDGAPVGDTPWEGTLGPGRHVLWTEQGERGSAPRSVIVVQGQSALARVDSLPLGPRLTIRATPSSATLAIDGVDIDAANFSGRLPVGQYTVVASETGYHSEARTLASTANAAPDEIDITLRIDPDHPRWPKGVGGSPWVSAYMGAPVGTSIGNSYQSDCASSCNGPPGFYGVLAGARAGYRFPIGLSLELSGGYLRVVSGFERDQIVSTEPGARYQLQHDVTLSGGFAGAGAGLDGDFGKLRVGSRVMAAAWFVRGQELIDGQVLAADGTTANVQTSGAQQTDATVSILASAELTGEWRFDELSLGAALGIGGVLLDGDAIDDRTLTVQHACSSNASPASAGCVASGAPLDAGEAPRRLHGPFVFVAPQLYVTRRF